MTPDKRNGPRTGDAGRLETQSPPSAFVDPIVPRRADKIAEPRYVAEHLAAIDGAFAVVVRTPSGGYRRRVWLTLAPAERAVERAHEQGLEASVVLVRLQPILTVGQPSAAPAELARRTASRILNDSADVQRLAQVAAQEALNAGGAS